MSDHIELQLKEELSNAKAEIHLLKNQYEEKLSGLKEEIGYLKEMIMAQNDMLKNAINHVGLLEKELKSLKSRINKGDFQGIH